MGGHPRVLADGGMRARFHNCELRACEMTQVPLPAAAEEVEEEEGASGGAGDLGADADAAADAMGFRLTHLDLEQALELAPGLMSARA